MKHYTYRPKGVCTSRIEFDLGEGHTVHNVRFTDGCNGNLKAIGKLVEGMPAERLCALLAGNTCGKGRTSCADQLACAVREAVAR